MPRYFCAVAAALVFLSGCNGCVHEEKADNPAEAGIAGREHRPIRLVAHRGESALAPENTVAAYRLTWRLGASWGAETDVYLTRDNVLVCNHDSTTERLSNVPGAIRDKSFAELRRIDVGRWKGEMWRGTQMPSLREVLEVLPPDKHMFVEIKSAGEGFCKAFEEARLGAGASLDQISIISFSPDELRNVRKNLPTVRTLLLTSIKRNDAGEITPAPEAMIAMLKELDVTGVDLHPYDLCLTAEYVKKIHDAGFELHVWTINTMDWALPLWKMGVDSITTDCSGKLYVELEAALNPTKEQK